MNHDYPKNTRGHDTDGDVVQVIKKVKVEDTGDENWCWKLGGNRFGFSEDQRSARMGPPVDGEVDQAVTGGPVMTGGRHYWEVLMCCPAEWDINSNQCQDLDAGVFFGAARPDQNCDDTGGITAGSPCHFQICSSVSAGKLHLFGNGKGGSATAAGGCDGDVSHVDTGEGQLFKHGDRIGCLLDLDEGWLRFFRNGVRLRQEYASGVTGPLVRSVEVSGGGEGVVLTALPGAATPEGQ
jgi:hypothetical protein